MRFRLFLLAIMVGCVAAQAGTNTPSSITRENIMELADPLSPQHDEEALVTMLQLKLGDEGTSRADRSWCEAMLAMAMKNRVGDVCADLQYVTAEGAEGNVHGIDSGLTLLFFNDPECLSCHQVKERLDTCDTLRDMVSRHELTVLALCVGGDETVWRTEEYPDYVVNAIDADCAVENNEIYELPTMPLFYLLDAEKRVLLKNEPSLNRVLQVLTANSQ